MAGNKGNCFRVGLLLFVFVDVVAAVVVRVVAAASRDYCSRCP